MRTAKINISFDNDGMRYEEAVVAFNTVKKLGDKDIAEYVGDPKVSLFGDTWMCSQEIKLTWVAFLGMMARKLFS